MNSQLKTVIKSLHQQATEAVSSPSSSHKTASPPPVAKSVGSTSSPVLEGNRRDRRESGTSEDSRWLSGSFNSVASGLPSIWANPVQNSAPLTAERGRASRSASFSVGSDHHQEPHLPDRASFYFGKDFGVHPGLNNPSRHGQVQGNSDRAPSGNRSALRRAVHSPQAPNQFDGQQGLASASQQLFNRNNQNSPGPHLAREAQEFSSGGNGDDRLRNYSTSGQDDQTRLLREKFQQMRFKNRSKSSYAAAWHVPDLDDTSLYESSRPGHAARLQIEQRDFGNQLGEEDDGNAILDDQDDDALYSSTLQQALGNMPNSGASGASGMQSRRVTAAGIERPTYTSQSSNPQLSFQRQQQLPVQQYSPQMISGSRALDDVSASLHSQHSTRRGEEEMYAPISSSTPGLRNPRLESLRQGPARRASFNNAPDNESMNGGYGPGDQLSNREHVLTQGLGSVPSLASSVGQKFIIPDRVPRIGQREGLSSNENIEDNNLRPSSTLKRTGSANISERGRRESAASINERHEAALSARRQSMGLVGPEETNVSQPQIQQDSIQTQASNQVQTPRLHQSPNHGASPKINDKGNIAYGDLMADVDKYFSSDDHRTRTRSSLAQLTSQQTQLLSAQSSGMNLPTQQPVVPGLLYIVEFKACRTDVFYVTENSGLEVHVGDLVIVEADRGRDLGKVTRENVTMPQVRALKAQQAREQAAAIGATPQTNEDYEKILNPTNITPKLIYRLSQPNEIAMLLVKSQDEQQAMLICAAKVRQRKLPMEVLDGEYQWDRRKLTFYYYASQRIDFRELVRDLFKIYKTRIWMCAVNPASTGSGSTNISNSLGPPGAIGEPYTSQSGYNIYDDYNSSYDMPLAAQVGNGVHQDYNNTTGLTHSMNQNGFGGPNSSQFMTTGHRYNNHPIGSGNGMSGYQGIPPPQQVFGHQNGSAFTQYGYPSQGYTNY